MDKNFTIEILLENPSFQNYSSHQNTEDLEKWNRIFEDSDEKDRATISQAKQLYKELTNENTETDIAKNRVWSKIENQISVSQKKSHIIPLYRWSAIAASILLILGAFFIFTNQNTKIVSSQEHLVELLPDGSQITLNSESTISYDKSKWNAERLVELKGEAFFDVEKGSPFSVVTENGTISVHGTSFNVFVRGENLIVSCHTGKVSVKTNDDEVFLQSGEVAIASKNSEIIQKSNFEPSELDWRSGIIRFNQKKVGFVLDELSRQFGVQVKASDEIRDMDYTGFFENTDLEKALYSICWPLQLNSVIQAKTVIIERNSQ